MTPVLEGFLIVAFLAFGAFWIDEGRPWLGALMVFVGGALFGGGLVIFMPWRIFRRRL